jgi:holo-[acyl-carrier protein] synthase
LKILGIGTDVIEIERIMKAGEKNPRFLERILTEKENEYCFTTGSRYQSAAARFAGKEAVAKALGCGFTKFSFLDIEILNDDSGKPEIVLKNMALKIFEESGAKEIHLSLSHSKETATAFVIIQG